MDILMAMGATTLVMLLTLTLIIIATAVADRFQSRHAARRRGDSGAP